MKLTSVFQLFLIGVMTFQVGCVTQKVRETVYETAQWETKVVVDDSVKKKQHTFNLEIWAQRGQRARLEVSALMGYKLASIVLDESDFSAVIYPREQSLQGKANAQSMRRALGFSIEPQALLAAAFDEKPPGRGWSCEASEDQFIKSCKNSSLPLTIDWAERTPEGEKTVLMKSPQWSLRWHFTAPQTSVQLKEALFELKVPSGYKTIQVD